MAFDEEPDDPHGECRHEIDRLTAELAREREANAAARDMERCVTNTVERELNRRIDAERERAEKAERERDHEHRMYIEASGELDRLASVLDDGSDSELITRVYQVKERTEAAEASLSQVDELREALRVIRDQSVYEWSEPRSEFQNIIDAMREVARNALSATPTRTEVTPPSPSAPGAVSPEVEAVIRAARAWKKWRDHMLTEDHDIWSAANASVDADDLLDEALAALPPEETPKS